MLNKKKPEFDFWQEHSLRYLEMAFRTDRHEKPASPDAHGIRTGDCGDTVEIFLTVDQDRIHRVSIATIGCINTQACANAVAELVEGKTLEEAWELRPEDVVAYLETLPAANHHCAELAVGALYRALADDHQLRKAAWKKPYLRR
jgi:nitrogen fixation NifU-like protein